MTSRVRSILAQLKRGPTPRVSEVLMWWSYITCRSHAAKSHMKLDHVWKRCSVCCSACCQLTWGGGCSAPNKCQRMGGGLSKACIWLIRVLQLHHEKMPAKSWLRAAACLLQLCDAPRQALLAVGSGWVCLFQPVCSRGGWGWKNAVNPRHLDNQKQVLHLSRTRWSPEASHTVLLLS